MNTVDLLEYLHRKTGLTYLSDLRQPGNLPLIQRALADIDAERYALNEWNEAVEYITGQKSHFSDASVAARFLRTWNA